MQMLQQQLPIWRRITVKVTLRRNQQLELVNDKIVTGMYSEYGQTNFFAEKQSRSNPENVSLFYIAP